VAQRQDNKLLKQLLDDNKVRNQALISQMQRKNDLVEEQMSFELFRMDADSVESKAFFALQRRKRLAALLRESSQDAAPLQPHMPASVHGEQSSLTGSDRSQSASTTPFSSTFGRKNSKFTSTKAWWGLDSTCPLF